MKIYVDGVNRLVHFTTQYVKVHEMNTLPLLILSQGNSKTKIE